VAGILELHNSPAWVELFHHSAFFEEGPGDSKDSGHIVEQGRDMTPLAESPSQNLRRVDRDCILLVS
jgi:hypothetical protein